MERMLRMNKDNFEYEIDRELTGKFAIEKNYEYQERIADLEEENKKLKEELGEKIDTIQVLIREKYEEKGEKLELFKENKKLKKECEENDYLVEDNARWIKECEKKTTEIKNLEEKLDKLQDEYDELYIEKCNASNQWKCCEAENKELKDELLTYMRK